VRFFRNLSFGAKIAASFAIVGVASAVAGLGTFATFTSSTSASTSVATGTVVVALGATGSVTNRLNIDASTVAAGDTMQRSVDLINSGTIDLSGVTLTTTAGPSSLLDTDVTDGLQMVIDKCSVAWTEAGVSPAFTYTCGGVTTAVRATVPVIGATLALSNLASLTAGTTDHLHITLTLPSTAGNTFQGLSSTVAFAFTGTQRTATNK
jgi:predicted ribosomally synthesized peptide with SipW-like signal peptide